MQNDTRTGKKTRRSSLCREMKFTVPSAWEELTQDQLRHVLRLLRMYQTSPDWERRLEVALLMYFCHIEVDHRTDQGWMCRERTTKKEFILAPELVPSMAEKVAWATRTEEISVRIEQAGSYRAVDFKLQELMFGDYLKVENFFQAFLLSKNESCLVNMARLLYQVPDEDTAFRFDEEVVLGVFLWFSAAKQELGRQFPYFLKAAGGSEPITRESLIEGMQAQIRLLTKGDVTKNSYILEKTDTWTALAELNAQAREAEEIKRKYGSKHV